MIDAIIKKIRASKDRGAARTALMARPFEFSEIQANHILDLMLGRLTQLGRDELLAEQKELRHTIRGLRKILAEHDTLMGLIADELTSVRDTYQRPRRAPRSSATIPARSAPPSSSTTSRSSSPSRRGATCRPAPRGVAAPRSPIPATPTASPRSSTRRLWRAARLHVARPGLSRLVPRPSEGTPHRDPQPFPIHRGRAGGRRHRRRGRRGTRACGVRDRERS